MPDIKHDANINAPAATVYKLIDNIAGLQKWLTTEEGWLITGDEKPGGILAFHLGEHGHDMKILKLDTDRQVTWECTKGHPEWLGTTVDFIIENKGNESTLYFGHKGWEKKTDFFNECNKAWGKYVEGIKKIAEDETSVL